MMDARERQVVAHVTAERDTLAALVPVLREEVEDLEERVSKLTIVARTALSFVRDRGRNLGALTAEFAERADELERLVLSAFPDNARPSCLRCDTVKAGDPCPVCGQIKPDDDVPF